MPKQKDLTPRVDCSLLETEQQDWDDADPDLLEMMLVELHIIRVFEEAVLQLAAEGLVHGPAHSSIGQEGGAVGSALALRAGDGITGTHRGHHQFLAKGLGFINPDGASMQGLLSNTAERDFIRRTMSEILGLKTGFGGGRGGSMHLQWREAGALGTNAIVGGGVPLAAGNAWAQRHDARTNRQHPSKKDNVLDSDVTVTYFGDGASNIGSTLETFNLASAWKLPLCFFVENNLYAVSTLVNDATGDSSLANRGPGFGIRSWQVDGMDPLAVYLAQRQSVEYMRAGKGPTLIEAKTYRYFHQNGPYPGSAFGYRSKEEEKEWKKRDPLRRVADEMIRREILTAEQEAQLGSTVQSVVTEIVGELVEKDPESSRGARRILPSLWPDPTDVDAHIRSNRPLGEIADGTHGPAQDGATENIKFSNAIAGVIGSRMHGDASIVLLGEDIHRLNGGTNGTTRGLAQSYPDRVLGTPISENAFSGLAGGLSMTGRYKPIVEFMYPDFLWVAADQLFNQIAKARHMFGGMSSMPVVLRTKVAMGTGYGSQHSMDPAGIFATSVGWRIVAPSTAADYIGLMNTALDLDDPVVIIEHVDLYTLNQQIPTNDYKYRLPLGRAAIRRPGSDVTVLSYLAMVQFCLDVADYRPDLDPEVIDLRWLDQASLDWETIGKSIKRTNSVLIVEQGAAGTSYGGWLADEIQRRYFDYLDQPVQRVTGGEASPSISKVLEAAANADANDVAAGFDVISHGLGRKQG